MATDSANHPAAGPGPRRFAMPEQVTRDWVAASALASLRPSGPLTLDFAATKRIDSAGVSLVHLLRREHEAAGVQFTVARALPQVLDALSAWSSPATPAGGPPPPDGFFGRVGGRVFAFYELALQALSVAAEMFYWGSIGLLRKRDFRKGSLGEQMYQLGYKAIGIVGLLSFLIGIVIALQSAMFLRTYGAGIYLASMIGWSMMREFGPLLTAIILAGRTGSATTAEIATMGVGEELDALKTMGISHYQFVIVPKFWAITLTMPLLAAFASAAGIFGAYLVSLFYLDIATSLFWNELCKYIAFRDFFAGFVKSVAFSWLIIWIGAFYGLKVRGGAEAVGRETTASVVTCIFVIILADALFSFVL
jgi:phospholipid/cholesterol/gamma-HCH transport system permease protein